MVKLSDRRSQVQQHEAQRRQLMLLCFGVGSAMLLTQVGQDWQAHSPSMPAVPPTPALQISSHLSLQTFGAQTVSTAFPQQSTRLVVDLSDRLLYVYQNDELLSRYPVAIGQAGWETPVGQFSVMYMQENPMWRHPITGEWIPPGTDNPLGTRWIGFWSNGIDQIGFHGTNQDDSIGQAVSHGCIRMYDRDIQALYQQVRLGTPVSIES